ncbi:MAG: DUF362 domain-containing protein [Desulfobacterales bacterium]|nr:DUF362 domain-containing protein [Desulfobacterales bacterium]
MRKLTRRSFLKKTAAVGALSLAGKSAAGYFTDAPVLLAATGKTDVVSVEGRNYDANTMAAIDHMGGIGAFVSPGDKVGLLVNSPFKNFGASVNPDVALAVIRQCADAGAREIRYLKDPHRGYWERTETALKFKAEMKLLKYESGDRKKVAINAGIKLKDAKVNADLFGCDTFINVSIAKHHDGVHYSGALKNMMGLCPFSTNSYFHFGGKLEFGFYGDLDHLSQCIADLNLVRQPDLCISDATAVITENGPYGPGPILKPHKVVAAGNAVSLDAYGSTLLGHQPGDILAIFKAARHNLGEMRLDRLNIREVKL